jgi:hypothetical protein
MNANKKPRSNVNVKTKKIGQEKRRLPRVKMGLPLKVEGQDWQIMDFSVGGICFRSKDFLPPGTTKEAVIDLIRDDGTKHKMEVLVSIWWCEPSPAGGYMVGAEVSANTPFG